MNFNLCLTVLVLSFIGCSVLVSSEKATESLVDLIQKHQQQQQRQQAAAHDQESLVKRVPFTRSKSKVKLPIKWGKRSPILAVADLKEEDEMESIKHELFRHPSCIKVYTALANANADVEKALEMSKGMAGSDLTLLKLYNDCLFSLLDLAYESELMREAETEEQENLGSQYEKRSKPFKWG